MSTTNSGTVYVLRLYSILREFETPNLDETDNATK
jgi:hypothetical protein